MKPKPFVEDLGFTSGAENLNGRLAMLAFAVAIGVELVTGHGFLGFLRLI
ncbi:MAG: chlorophyll A-B binding protein [Leptolyngbya sp. SIO1E4]|nr:chlorophyll A-B binding protein [Leptolyngbya sp. SIO1E4]